MGEGIEDTDGTDAIDPAAAAMGATGVPVRVEPDAAVVSVEAPVPPDLHEDAAPAIRPMAAVRAVGSRLRRLVPRDGRSGSDRDT
ncbi:hypothetical protein [Halobaculum rarum]|uniref:hypothetical protein n=1 Tax=Halobaculum rarum TaxID=3075122 RepID=UPI0032AFCE3B